MHRMFRWFLTLVVVTALLAAAPVSCNKGSRADEFPWITIDESYVPRNPIEEFIKTDSAQRGVLPVYIKDYDRDKSILRRFVGSNFARPNQAALNMAFKGLEDWMLVDIKYNNEKGQEVLRTVLYVKIDGQWRVGDSGTLQK
jgi:hypothetical protein